MSTIETQTPCWSKADAFGHERPPTRSAIFVCRAHELYGREQLPAMASVEHPNFVSVFVVPTEVIRRFVWRE